MNPFGTFTPSQFLPPASPKNIDVGVPWEYIRVINNSPYALQIGLGGQGTINFPEGWLEDIPVDRSFNGKLTFTPVANYSGTAIARALANYVTVNAYRIGELAHPQAQPIGTVGSTANISQEYQETFANQMSLDVSGLNSASQSLGATFPNIAQVSAGSPGYLLLGYLSSGGAREMIVPYRNGYREGLSSFQTVTVPIGGGVQTFQLVNSTAIGSLGFQSFTAAIGVLSIGDITVDDNDGNFSEVFLSNGNIGGSGVSTLLSLINQFGPYGFETIRNPSAGGMRVRLSINNSSGATQTFGFQMMGSRFAFDDIICTVSFTDWATPSNTWTIARHRLSEAKEFPLDFLVPTPITNPVQTTFGTLTYTVINTTEFYASHALAGIYTIDFVIPALLIIPGSGT